MSKDIEKSPYPRISKKGLDDFIRQLSWIRDGSEIKELIFNAKSLALHLEIEHKKELPLFLSEEDIPEDINYDLYFEGEKAGVNEVIDQSLAYFLGMEFRRDRLLDDEYGERKWYTKQVGKGMWLAEGDNHYSEDFTRLDIEWVRKLDREMVNYLSIN